MSPRSARSEAATGSGRDALPEEQQQVLRRAIRLEWITIAVLSVTIAVVGVVTGQSQAMKAAWLEDMLSLLPPIAFLVAARRIRIGPDRDHPYGHHRSIGVAHLVAAIALLAMGSFLVIDSVMGLVKVEKPPIGIVVLFGHPLWAGWLMVIVMAASAVAPVILGRKKLKLAEQLHDKVLFADADMNKADWSTAVATIIGVLGIGIGLWWFDAAAAIIVSISILRDGFKNLRAAVGGLTDARARTYDEKNAHPLTREVEQRAAETSWVDQAVGRVRDQGHVFHVEMFVVPKPGQNPSVEQFTELREALCDLDWKIHDVVVVPVPEISRRQAPAETARHGR